MGTYTDAYFAHSLCPSSITELPRRLNQHVTAVRDVEAYWQQHDPSHVAAGVGWVDAWRADWTTPPPADNLFADGDAYFRAGSVSISFYPHAAILSCGARWRGFLSIPKLRAVHLRVASQLATMLDSPNVIWVPDYYDGPDILGNSGTIAQIMDDLRARWGPAQPNVAVISDNVLERTCHSPPDVWYHECCST